MPVGRTLSRRGVRPPPVSALPVTGGLGPELITNGTFDNNGAGWTFIGGSGDGNFAGGQANLNGEPLAQTITGIVAGASYRLTGTRPTSSALRTNLNGGGLVTIPTGTGAFSIDLVAGSTAASGLQFTDLNGTSTLDNVSLKRVL